MSTPRTIFPAPYPIVQTISQPQTLNPALFQGYGDVVKVLLEAKADVHAESTEGGKCPEVSMPLLLCVLVSLAFNFWQAACQNIDASVSFI